MPKSKKTTAKSSNKRRGNIRRRYKVWSKKITRFRKKIKRIARRQNRLIHTRAKRTFKQLLKSFRAPSKKSAHKTKASKQNRKAHVKTGKYRLRSVVLITLLTATAGIFCGYQLQDQGYANYLGDGKKGAASSKVTSFGPAQSDERFSTYPTWAQNFETAQGKPDSRYWNIFKGEPDNNNQEAQYYTDNPANIRIKDGALSLTATHEPNSKNRKYASARVDTEHKVAFRYGRMDVTAKLPKGSGTWPAIWFLPDNNKYSDLSPESDTLRYINGGEIDMTEAVGLNPGIVYGVVHSRSDLKNPDRIGAFNEVSVPDSASAYNLYSMLWTPDSITYAVNNKPYFTYARTPGADYTTWPFDQPFYIIINLAMGGIWAGEDNVKFPGNGIDNSALPASLNVKSIHYYSYRGPQPK